MFFPAHWWHEVHNHDEEALGLGFGFRPNKPSFRHGIGDALDALLTAIFPARANPGVAMHRVAMFSGRARITLQKIFSNLQSETNNDNGGIKGREAGFCKITEKMQKLTNSTWTWNKMTGGPS